MNYFVSLVDSHEKKKRVYVMISVHAGVKLDFLEDFILMNSQKTKNKKPNNPLRTLWADCAAFISKLGASSLILN